MSTKNLARTVVEGGRSGRWRERYGNRVERQRVRAGLRQIAVSGEDGDAFDVASVSNEYYGTDFKDKLGPAIRWLDANVGRVWNDVHSEIRQKFDYRTTKGRHIIDHIVGEFGYVNFRQKAAHCYGYVDDKGVRHEWCSSSWFFEVDVQGILRRKKK